MLPRKEIPLNMSYILFRNVYCGNAGDKTRVMLVLSLFCPHINVITNFFLSEQPVQKAPRMIKMFSRNQKQPTCSQSAGGHREDTQLMFIAGFTLMLASPAMLPELHGTQVYF